MIQPEPIYGAVEGGGTKFLCAIGNQRGDLLDQQRFPTLDPATTLESVIHYFHAARDRFGPITRLGVGTFGPIDLNRRSPRYGQIISTPKAGWTGADLVRTLHGALRVPVDIDTDVNAAALGELVWGAARGLGSVAYITVGTGIGVGVVHRGHAVHGLLHPEAGHLLVRRHAADQDFKGCCPFHGDCLEGLASGTAVQARLGHSIESCDASYPIWDILGAYVGQLCSSLVLTHAPERILLGGGLGLHPLLLPRVREHMGRQLGGYPDVAALSADDYLIAPGLGSEAGIKGALALAVRRASDAGM